MCKCLECHDIHKQEITQTMHDCISEITVGTYWLSTSCVLFHLTFPSALYRTLSSNMVTGVATGYTRVLELVGTGFRAAVAGKELTLNVGYCVPRILSIPEGITVKVSLIVPCCVCWLEIIYACIYAYCSLLRTCITSAIES